MNNYKLVLGLEIHIHVKTQTKMFCGCSADVYSAEPNTHTCPTCLGLPGALPVPNESAIKKTQHLGLALNSELTIDSIFDRKHYFYPDLPKGYQISQYKNPVCKNGWLELLSGKKIEIERIHIEEDTAKSFHENGKTLIDFNVSGMPLIELVTKPIFENAEDAVEFCKKLRDLVRWLDISDADMEKGQMRLEPNISIRTQEMEKKGELPNYKVEVKNINSFRFMEKAVNYEFERQMTALANGETLIQENRGWNESLGKTVSQRDKEEAHDYRYFPEPDIPPLHFDESYLNALKASLFEIPWQIKGRLMKDYELNESSAEALTTSPGIELLEKFEQLVRDTKIEAVKVANLLLNRPEFREYSAEDFKKAVEEMESGIFDEKILLDAILAVLAENEDAVQNYLKGKESALQFLMGQVMRNTRGKADPEVTIKLLRERLDKND